MERGHTVEHVQAGRAGRAVGVASVEDVPVCRICLVTDCKLYQMSEHEALCEVYETLTGLTLSGESPVGARACGACSRRLSHAARLRAGAVRAHAVLAAALLRHGRITIESIQSVRALHGPPNSDLKQETGQLDLDGDVVDKHTDDMEQINKNPLDDIKTEVMIEEIVDEEGTGVGVDISSLRDDITMEVMGAEHDDAGDEIGDETGDGAGDGAGDAIWMSGLHAVEVKNEDVFNDSVEEDFKCEYQNDLVVGGDSSGPSPLPDRMTRKGRQRRSEETEGGLRNSGLVSCDRSSYQAKTVAGLLGQLKSESATKYYNCNQCSYVTTRVQYLAQHRKRHSGKESYPCHVCKRLFTFKSYLQNHLKIHTGVKPYLCSVCDKSFRRSDHLKMHLNIHSGQKPYACDVCDKAFKTKNILRQHVQLHSSEKSYSCEYCNKSFIRKCNLQAHLRTHTGEKPYSCNVCNQRFSLQCNLKYHLKNYCNGI